MGAGAASTVRRAAHGAAIGTVKAALLAAMLLGIASPAAARMYQWVNPETGSVQLSGTPPSWYRSDQPGPRVRVFSNGRLIDDTSLAVTDAQREALRDAAFRELEERRELEALRRLEHTVEREAAREDRDRLRREQEQRLAAADEEAAGGGEKAEGEQPAAGDAPEDLDPETIERLKEIVSEWDRLNLGAPGQ